MNKILIFLLIILLILIYYNYKSIDNNENFDNLENNVTFTLYPNINDSGKYNSFDINVSSSNFLFFKDGVYSDYMNYIKDISKKNIISQSIKDDIYVSDKDHTMGGRYIYPVKYAQGKTSSTENNLQELYLINNSDSNKDNVKVKNGEYYFIITGKRNDGTNVKVNYTLTFSKDDFNFTNFDSKENEDNVTNDNDYFYIKGVVDGDEDKIFFKPRMLENRIFKIYLETSENYNSFKIQLKSSYDDNVIQYTDHYDTVSNRVCIKNCNREGFQNVSETYITDNNYGTIEKNNFLNLYYPDNDENYEYNNVDNEDYEDYSIYDILDYSIYDILSNIFGYKKEYFKKKLKKIKKKAKKATKTVSKSTQNVARTSINATRDAAIASANATRDATRTAVSKVKQLFVPKKPEKPVYVTKYTYKYKFDLDKHIDYNLKLDLAPVIDGKFKILKDTPDKNNNQIWRNINDSYGEEYLEDDKNFNYNNEVNKRYFIDNNSDVKVSNNKNLPSRNILGLHDSNDLDGDATLGFRGADNNSKSMFESKFHEYIKRDLDKDNQILTESNSSFNINVTNIGNQNVHQVKLIYNFSTIINDIGIIQVVFDTNNDLNTFYNHMHKIYIGSNKVINKKDLIFYDKYSGGINSKILLIVENSLFSKDDIENWLTETIGRMYNSNSDYKVYGFSL